MNQFYSNQGASTSTDPYSNQLLLSPSLPQFVGNVHMRDSSPIQHMQDQSTWNTQIQGSLHNMNPQGQQQPFQQQQWANSQNQAFPSMMAGFNMPFLPPQVLQDALQLATPVTSADEPVLVQNIIAGLKQGLTYKAILNGMHGKQDHSASLWKDYYLEHKPRLDAWINMCLQSSNNTSASSTPVIENPRHTLHSALSAPSRTDKQHSSSLKTIKKPSPSAFRKGSTPIRSSAAPTGPTKKPKVEPDMRATPQALAQATGSRRATINSLTVGAPVFDRRNPPPHAEIKIPDPPSRSPSPPTTIVPKGRGHKFTDEDATFFIKFIHWHMKNDPNLTRGELYQMLAEKAPHHPAQSWASYWSMNHDLPDKIFAAYRDGTYEENETSRSSTKDQPSSRKRPRYRDLSTSEEELDGDEDDGDDDDDESFRKTTMHGKQRAFGMKHEVDEDDDTPLRVYQESEMGGKGSSFTDADMYITAKYISEFRNWDKAMSKDRWAPFANRFPHRSSKSWAEYYRRYEPEIDRLVAKIKKQSSRE